MCIGAANEQCHTYTPQLDIAHKREPHNVQSKGCRRARTSVDKCWAWLPVLEPFGVAIDHPPDDVTTSRLATLTRGPRAQLGTFCRLNPPVLHRRRPRPFSIGCARGLPSEPSTGCRPSKIAHDFKPRAGRKAQVSGRAPGARQRRKTRGRGQLERRRRRKRPDRPSDSRLCAGEHGSGSRSGGDAARKGSHETQTR